MLFTCSLQSSKVVDAVVVRLAEYFLAFLPALALDSSY